MNILAIETSCDETAISLFTANETDIGIGFNVLSNITHSQVDMHVQYGGVFPQLAKREHQRNLVPILLKTLGLELKEGNTNSNPEINSILEREVELLEQFNRYILSIPKPDIDIICVTSGPGLEPALWVGISFAKALGKLWNIPVVPVNHMEGHILSVLVPENNSGDFSVSTELFPFPALALLISGGHTEMVLVRDLGDYEIVGKTRDDAVGEAFDKTARILGLPYPGGPEVSKLALQHDKSMGTNIELPRPMIHSGDLTMSFSGLKTAVLTLINNLTAQNIILEGQVLQDIARSIEESITDVLVKKSIMALKQTQIKTLVVSGGVSANLRLREKLDIELSKIQAKAFYPPLRLCTDNGAMIALAGAIRLKQQKFTYNFNVHPRWDLTTLASNQ